MNGEALQMTLNGLLNRRTWRALAILVAAGSIGVFAVSSAYFSSTDSTSMAQLQAGTVHISSTASGTWTDAVGNLLPGASVTSDISVDDTGTAAVAYAVSLSSASDEGVDPGFTAGDFLAALHVDIYDDTCANIATAVRLNNSVGTDALSPARVLVGDTAPYEQSGDLYLAASGSQHLCVQVTFPDSGLDDQNTLQGATADFALGFDATQIDAAGSVSH
jgi:predicted ribosomally synthesized peptide with SipW-like signal peptide